MRVLVVCQSVSHGNTGKIAEAMAEVLGAEVARPSEVQMDGLAQCDLVGFGSGIFFGKHHKALLRLIGELPRLRARAFLFSTRGAGPAKYYHRALRAGLQSKGLEIVGEFSARGWDTYGLLRYIGGINRGRPNESDLERARAFARGLLTG
jgi:flavodoxin